MRPWTGALEDEREVRRVPETGVDTTRNEISTKS